MAVAKKHKTSRSGRGAAPKPPSPDLPDRSGPRFRTVIVIAGCLLLAGGAADRTVEKLLFGLNAASVPLKEPLASLPRRIGPWIGEDQPLDENVRRIANEDAYLNRRYDNEDGKRSVTLYVGYVGGARKIISHRPDVCYAAHGFEQVAEQRLVLTTPDGEQIPSVIYQFSSSGLVTRSVLVLAIYLVNGEYTSDKAVFGGFNLRHPNLFGDVVPYVARIQVSTIAGRRRDDALQVLREFAGTVVGRIADKMPSPEPS